MNDAYDWINRIIDSCNNPFHVDCARRLVDCFRERFGETAEYHQLLEKLIAKEPMILV